MSTAATIRRNVLSGAVLLPLVMIGPAGCADNVVVSGAGPGRAPAPLGFELTPLQQQLLMSTTSSEAAAGRPATRADLEEARSWFGPGELEAVLAIVNRSARARGADTLQHCFPLCGPASRTAEPGTR
jgi:hypothetical protein